ncbi:MAG: DUF1294 domain-containing protein [Bacilli bacterium]|nr:DUF1294 domain-containing protein [Bacilli bacterium]
MLIYYILINILEFSLMGIDKYKAINNSWRIPEKLLFGIALIGGSLGGILGMEIFRHKTKKRSFQILLPLFLLLNIYILIK